MMYTDTPSDKKLLAGFGMLFDNPETSDLTIAILSHGRTIKVHVHKLVLHLRTDFFKESSVQSEFNTNKHSAHAIWRFLKYCYTGDYPNTADEEELLEEPDDPPALKHVRVHALANMLGCDLLKKTAAAKA